MHVSVRLDGCWHQHWQHSWHQYRNKNISICNMLALADGIWGATAGNAERFSCNLGDAFIPFPLAGLTYVYSCDCWSAAHSRYVPGRMLCFRLSAAQTEVRGHCCISLCAHMLAADRVWILQVNNSEGCGFKKVFICRASVASPGSSTTKCTATYELCTAGFCQRTCWKESAVL